MKSEDDYLHFNWDWGGQQNGFYAITNCSSSGFNNNHAIIIGSDWSPAMELKQAESSRTRVCYNCCNRRRENQSNTIQHGGHHRLGSRRRWNWSSYNPKTPHLSKSHIRRFLHRTRNKNIEISSFRVYNTFGKLLFSNSLTKESNDKDLSTHPDGICFLQLIEDGKDTSFQKIVKVQ